jgi:hypothetical protein
LHREVSNLLQFDKKKSGISASFDPRDKIRIYLRSL